MKLLFVLAAFAAVVAAWEVPRANQRESELSAFGYLTKYGVPAAEARRKAEEKLLTSRIIGGEVSEEGRFPYQAGILISLFSGETAMCGGALISPTRVATAAHCWWDGINSASQFTVILGSNLLFSGGLRVTTDQVFVHWDWNPVFVRNDLAIVHLPWPVTHSDIISPIRLPTGSELNESFADLAATASGFGYNDASNTISIDQALSHVHLHILNNQLCAMGFPSLIQDTNLCTSGTFGINVCGGDSGGPLAINRGNAMVLVGIYSFGSSLGCTAGLPAIHTRVTSFIDFFQQHLN